LETTDIEEKLARYLFLASLASIIASSIFFLIDFLVNGRGIHYELLNANLPFYLLRNVPLIIAIIILPAILLSMAFLAIERKEVNVNFSRDSFRVSAVVFFIEFLIFSASFYISPSSSQSLKGFTNLDFSIYYSVWTLYLGAISIIPPCLAFFILNAIKDRKTKTSLSSVYNLKSAVILSIPFSIFSDILWSSNITLGIQYYPLFFLISFVVFLKGPIIGTFASLMPLESNIIAYSFYGLFEIPYIFFIMILILMGLIYILSIIPKSAKDKNMEKSIVIREEPKEKVEQESWIRGKCPVCGGSSFLISRSNPAEYKCQKCGFEIQQ
jgi:predicted RNA-binding Zn-ribbon protein involved in translation (DUF1610 family)